jgi:tRNA(Arg) A34 adenosine deaminase TadA
MPEPISPADTSDDERRLLRRCIDLAREALDDGDEPFGSVLVDATGTVRFEDRNRVGGGDETRHPEFEIAKWAATNLSPDERRTSVVYTTGEHCPMCRAAHAWVGLGRIVHAASSEQLSGWLRDWGLPESPVACLPIGTVAPGIDTRGPFAEFTAEIRALHARLHGIDDEP